MKIIYFINCGGSNAGDKFCSPNLFYDFKNYEIKYSNNFNIVNKLKNSIVIFGGGGILDTNVKRNKYYKNIDKSNIYFHWGSGSNKLNVKKAKWKINKNEIKANFDKLENFIYVGRRDYFKNYLKNHEYLPCVSCKIPELKLKYEIKRRIGIIQHMWLQQIKNMNYPTINMNLSKYSIKKIIEFIGESEVIITGSYHAAYWSLLMGKKVIINGNWSSKFDYLKYKPIILSDNLENDILNCKVAPLEYLDECIDINNKFYEKIMNYINNIN